MAGARKNRRSGSCAQCGRKVGQWAGEERVVDGQVQVLHLAGICDTAPDGLRLDGPTVEPPTAVLPSLADREEPSGEESGMLPSAEPDDGASSQADLVAEQPHQAGDVDGTDRSGRGAAVAMKPLWRTGGVRALAVVLLVYCGIGASSVIHHVAATSGDRAGPATSTVVSSSVVPTTVRHSATTAAALAPRPTSTAPTTTSVAADPLAGERTSSAPNAAAPCGTGTYENATGSCVRSPVHADLPPSGASAQCADGTYSFSQHRRGTCSHHGGVRSWLE